MSKFLHDTVVCIEVASDSFVAAILGPDGSTLYNPCEKGSWIIQKLYSFKNMNYRPIKREFVNGESFMYLGRNYSIQIEIDFSIKKP